ncbi:DUF7860 family protein [Natronorubrum aibiense]|uniref:Uncharacterized protein n=1 Tax=Natronorubrum aibiense TaxID=348826 RepID=A0A5P9PA66_9EURY|nr:hypothetical protein [Natronorubrum aibiense]QFU85039.1 hypothetical protein GCU68_21215 [Natronorubrum aibiense]
MGRYGNLDYSFLTKAGFLFGLGLLLFGASGEILGHAVFGDLPAWQNTLFTYSEGVGLVISFVTPWIFGIFLPLTE